ncbi:MAG: CheR family methyltransferase, partial [Chloroflexota bacterium]
VLSAQAMAEQLINYVRRVHEGSLGAIPSLQKDEDLYKKLFILLRAQTGHDFSLYKPNTIIRRIKRRMAVQQLQMLDEYLRMLQQTPAEVEALFRDFLIGVTNFFRDPPVFETLEKQVIPHIFAGKASGATIRVWVPGCSSGEEAYSIAILMQEYAFSLKTNFKLQIFATDIDSHAIETARSGIFTANIAADITSERLSHFFDQLPDGNFRIHKQIRDMLVFSEHDLIKDPPFSKLDLISCRNVLIYMGHELQKKLIPLFHYGLNPDGILVLGTSESVGDYLNLFTPLDRKSKIYTRKLDSYSTYRPAMMKYVPTSREQLSRLTGQNTIDGKLPLRDVIERALLQKYAPTAMLVNERGDILYLHGRSGRYLEPAQGDTMGLMNVIKMAREGLRPSLTTALHRSVTHHQMVTKPGLRVKTNGDYSTVNLFIQPISFAQGKDDPQNVFMVILEETAENDHENANLMINSISPEDLDERIKALKQELRDKEEYIQSSNEELETTNEELKSSNEEMQSVNEELQSTNEELETAKEELQSVNEELATVNTELQQKVLDLTRVNNDMNNLLASTGVGTIFVDHQLLIQRFTASITPVINLIAGDVGRPVGHIVSNLIGYDALVEDVKNVLSSLIPRDVEVQTTLGIWYLLRIQPYRTVENVIEGAVITFTDITELKKGQAAQNENDHLRKQAKVIQDATDAIVVQDLTGKILGWNPAAEKIFGWSLAEALSKNIRDLISEEKRKETMNVFLKVSQGEVMSEFETVQISKSGQAMRIKVTATSLSNINDEIYAISATEKVFTA